MNTAMARITNGDLDLKIDQKVATNRHRGVLWLCIRSHRYICNYQVCSYTWSVPYTRRYLSHTRLRLHKNCDLINYTNEVIALHFNKMQIFYL